MLKLTTRGRAPFGGLYRTVRLRQGLLGFLLFLMPPAAQAALYLGPATSYPTDIGPHGVTVGDFAGNASVDLAVVNFDDETVSVYPNSGTGAFGAAITSDLETRQPRDLAAGDLNGDDILDLVIIGDADNQPFVVLGIGGGAFGAPALVPASPSDFVLGGLMLGDLNGDDRLDLVVVAGGEALVGIWLGQGNGTFGPCAETALSDWASGFLDLQDINEDGDLDAVFSTDTGVEIFLGDGTGALQAGDIIARDFAAGVRIADRNGDGDLDLFFNRPIEQTVNVYDGHGDGTFTAAFELPALRVPDFLEVGDLDGDGDPDAVFGCAAGVAAFENTGVAFGSEQGVSNAQSDYGQVVDVNADGTADIIATREFEDEVVVHLSYSAPRITSDSGANATVGQAMSFDFTATGAPVPALSLSGTLPTGLAFTDNADGTGTLAGTPTASGTFPLTLTASNGVASATQSFVVTVSTSPSITTSSLPGWTRDRPGYSQSVSASGGTGALAFTITAGALPAGLAIAAATGLITGTPTAVGAATFTVTATDTLGAGHSRSFSISVSQPPEITTLSLPGWTAGRGGYSQTLAASGGTAPLSYTTTAGGLPAGLSLADNGVVSGTPTTAGSFTFTITVTDAAGGSDSQDYSVTVNAAPSLPATPLAAWTAQHPGYAQTLTTSGGTAPFSYAATGGTLPPGLSLSAAGAISGTPTTAGNFSFSITVTDNTGGADSRDYAITVNPGVSLPAVTLASWTAPLPGYSQNVAGSNGTGTLAHSISSGSLPAGLALATNGSISGTPTTPGAASFTVTATDSVGATASRSYPLTINAAPAIITTALPGWTATLPGYSQAVATSGGTGAMSYALSAGALPAGLSLGAEGAISGTPTTVGTASFTVKVTDTLGAAESRSFSIVVAAPPAVTTTALAPWTQDLRGYSQSIAVSGGTSPLSYAVAAGALPPGLALSASGGELAGKPAVAGTFEFAVKVTDAAGGADQRSYVLEINPPPSVVDASLPTARAGAAYAYTIQFRGGTGELTRSLVSGTPPGGLTLDLATGLLSGRALAPGSASFTIQLTDRLGVSGSRGFTLQVDPSGPLAIETTSLPTATAGVAYDQTIVASGGTAPLGFAVITGAPPSGFSLDSATGRLSGTAGASGSASFTVRATDAAGATATQAYGLEVVSGAPAAGQSGLAGSPAALPADGRSTVTLALLIRDSNGNPVAGVPPSALALSADPAAGVIVTGPSLPTDASGRTTATATSTRAGTVGFSASLHGAPLPQTATARFEPTAPNSARSSMSLDREAILANGTDTAVLTIQVRDEQGNAVPNLSAESVTVTAAAGLEIGSSGTNASGVAVIRLTSRAPGSYPLTVFVAGVALAPAPTLRVDPRLVSAEFSRVTLTPELVASNGSTAARLAVELRDAGGEAVVGSPASARDLVVVADDGLPEGVSVTDAGAASDATGRFELELRAGRRTTFRLTPRVAGVGLQSVTLRTAERFQASLPAGLHLVGLPFIATDSSPVGVLGNGTWRLARWDASSGRYVTWRPELAQEPFAFNPGRGLWLELAAPAGLDLLGEAVPAGTFDLVLEQGWATSANPFDAHLPWDTGSFRVLVNGTDRGPLSDPSVWSALLPVAWIYDSLAGRHRVVADPSLFSGVVGAIPRLGGFWAQANQAGVSLRLSAPASRTRSTPAAPSPRDWAATLQAEAGGAGAELILGVSSKLTRELQLQRPPIEQPAVDLVVVEGNDRSAGSLQPPGDVTSWDLLACSRAGGELTLSWPSLLRQLPRGLVLELTDQETGRTLLVNTASAYRYLAQPGEERALRLTARLGQIARSSVTSLTATPTRGRGLTLTLVLTAPGEAMTSVRSLSGRMVKQLDQGMQPAGTAQLGWDGTDQAGRPVPAGSYQVEVTVRSANGALSRAVRTVTVR